MLKVTQADQQNLKTEIKLHKSLRHKNIIRFFDALQEKHMVYILLEVAANGSLFFYIPEKTGLSEDLSLRFLYQTALAVDYLHSRKLVHRDIKPENILLDENFNIKLCDFGWSCFLEEHDMRSTICGTYEYMSPEILHQDKHSNKVDVWCLGILMYEMIYGWLTRQASLHRREPTTNEEELYRRKYNLGRKDIKRDKELYKGDVKGKRE